MNFVKISTAYGDLDAEMLKGFLEAQGINVTLSQESLGKTYGLSVGSLGTVDVLVPEDQEADALNILAAMEAGEFEVDEGMDAIEDENAKDDDE